MTDDYGINKPLSAFEDKTSSFWLLALHLVENDLALESDTVAESLGTVSLFATIEFHS